VTTVTVLSGPERRRRWTTAQKLRIVEESLAPGASVVEVARRHDVMSTAICLRFGGGRRAPAVTRRGVRAPIGILNLINFRTKGSMLGVFARLPDRESGGPGL
jgi:transposase-like protein